MKKPFALLSLLLVPFLLAASGSGHMPSIGPVRVEFILFGMTLVGVALLHKHTMWVAICGLSAVLVFKFAFDPKFNLLKHIFGSPGQEGEWRILLNLLGLLFRF